MVISQLTSNTFGQYAIREQIGKGGMGIVYRAYQTSLQREVAFKVLSIFLATPTDLKRFQNEARTAATLEHPNIVPIYDYGTQDGVNFVVMRLLGGGSLAQRTGVGLPRMSLPEITQITIQLASALDYAHSRGVIHRDVKPTNILFDDHNVPYLVDFGIVKLLHNSTSMTNSDEIVGSLPYIAPDQLFGAEPSPAVDQYALAVTVYLMLTDHLPHEADSPFLLMNKRLNLPPEPLQTYRPDLSDEIALVLGRALEMEAANRYENVTAFALAFYEAVSKHEGFQQGSPSLAHLAQQMMIKSHRSPTPAPTQKSMTRLFQPPRQMIIGIVAIVLLLIVTGGWVMSQSRGQGAEASPTHEISSVNEITSTVEPNTTITFSTTSVFVRTQAALLLTSTPAPCRVRMRSRAYVRSGPGTGYDVVRAYDSGWTTSVVGKTTDAEGNLWWYVNVPSLSAIYWVADEVTDQIGDCAIVPSTTP
jgi:serine/threonine protein kinase